MKRMSYFFVLVSFWAFSNFTFAVSEQDCIDMVSNKSAREGTIFCAQCLQESWPTLDVDNMVLYQCVKYKHVLEKVCSKNFLNSVLNYRNKDRDENSRNNEKNCLLKCALKHPLELLAANAEVCSFDESNNESSGSFDDTYKNCFLTKATPTSGGMNIYVNNQCKKRVLIHGLVVPLSDNVDVDNNKNLLANPSYSFKVIYPHSGWVLLYDLKKISSAKSWDFRYYINWNCYEESAAIFSCINSASDRKIKEKICKYGEYEELGQLH
ncbi:MAG: hypothetical protein HQK53_08460 [Oligoflexia bacterium]|nr:hypothetical protein [Oligoflexia bacterium]